MISEARKVYLAPERSTNFLWCYVMIYFYELVNEGDDSSNENTENEYVNENLSTVESNDYVSGSDSTADSPCTLVYSSDFEMVCAESLIPSEPVTQVQIVQTEEQIERDQTTEQLLRTLTTQQQSILNASDTTASLELSQDIHDTLTDIYDYVGLFVGLYFVGWLFAQMNSWRRNNR